MKQFDIFKDLSFSNESVTITPLGESESQKFIRIAFLEAQMMKEHKTKFPIAVQIIKGRIDFGVYGERHILEAGAIVLLEPNIPHELVALEQSIVLLTLAKSDSVTRVQNVVFKQP